MKRLAELSAPERLVDLVYASIRAAILRNELPPGQHLSVPEVARQLGVSRSPVREAVVRLERDGLVQSNPHRGAVVAQPDAQQLQELYEVREALEGFTARLAASRLDESEIEELRSLLQAHESALESGDLDDYVGTDLEFHAHVRRASRNPRLIQLHEMLEAQIRVALYATASQPGNMELAHWEHAELLAALEAGDPGLAEERARRHVERVRGLLVLEALQGAEDA